VSGAAWVVSAATPVADSPAKRWLPVVRRPTVTASIPAIPAAQRGKYSVRAVAGRINRLTRVSNEPPAPVAASASRGVVERRRSIPTSAVA